jgi:hypothetical protein
MKMEEDKSRLSEGEIDAGLIEGQIGYGSKQVYVIVFK